MIYFTGGGCYHPDMLTIGAMKLLQKADCVLYDHLINKEFLQYTKKDCECISVGKTGHGTSTKQEDIMKLLITKNRQHIVVVRLKGGDPYLYGRGSEEMAFCLENGIDCQYVPGISSAIGGLGFAGIPVTERGLSSGFHVHTLHYQDGIDHLDYKAIASSDETEIFFMGSTKITKLVQSCLSAGMDKHTPVAIASHLTMPDQKVLVSTLSDIQQEDITSFTSPLLIVLGKTANRHMQLDNTIHLPYYGKKILLTSIDETHWPVDLLTLEKGIFVHERQVGTIVFHPEKNVDISAGRKVVVGIRPEMIRISDSGRANAVIDSSLPYGMETVLCLKLGDIQLLVVVFGSIDFPKGSRESIEMTGNGICLFDKESGELLSVGSAEFV